MKSQTKTIIFFTILYLQCFSTMAGSVSSVGSKAEFVQAVEVSQPGDTIIVKNGTYADWGEIRFESVSGTEGQPIVIKSELVYGATFTGDIWLRFVTCDHVQFNGFRFANVLNERGRALNFQSGNYNTVSQCSFINSGNVNNPMNMLRFDADLDSNPQRNAFNTIKNCFFSQVVGVALTVTVADSKQNIGQNKVINNVFRDADKILSNGGEAMVLYSNGKQENNPLYCYVEGNLFDNWNGDPEVISVKSGRNLLRHNVFTNSDYSFLSLRREKANIIEANIFRNLNMGIWVYAEEHLIKNNMFDGIASEAIRLSSAGSSSNTVFEAANNNLIAHNTFLNTEKNVIRFLWDKNYYYGSRPFGNKFYNNVMASDSGIFLNPSDDELEMNTFDYNLYWTDGTAEIPKIEEHNIKEDPLLKRIAEGYYVFSDKSPVIDKGLSLEYVQKDFFGNKRNQSDIGHVAYPLDTTSYKSPYMFLPPDISGFSTKPDKALFDYYPKYIQDGDVVMLDVRKSKGGYQKISWKISGETSAVITESVYSFIYDSTKIYKVKLMLLDGEEHVLDSITQELVFVAKTAENDFPSSVLPQYGSNNESSIILYPNPCDDHITVKRIFDETIDYRIYNLKGTKIHSGKLNTDSKIDVRKLPIGTYLLKCGNNPATQMIVIH